MDKELINEIGLFFNNRRIHNTFLSAKEGESLIQRIAAKFFLDIKQRYLWEGKQAKSRIDYDSEGNGISYILSLLHNFDKNIYLTITDDEFFPWPIVAFNRDYLIPLLEELQYFEFFIFDETMRCILFDTHHNAILFF